jgi:hypothetical protein
LIAEVAEQEFADGGVVSHLGFAESLEAMSGEADESAAFVGGVRGSFDESGFGEFVDGAGDAARG